MVCCIVATLIVGGVYRLMPWRGRARVDAGFPPVAHWPGTAAPTAVGDVGPVTTRARPLPAGLSWLIHAAAIGAAANLATVFVLVATGAADTVAAADVWLARTVVVAGLAVAVIAVARHAARANPVTMRRWEAAALLCVGAGAAWLEVAETDMHLLHLYVLPNPLINNVFHGLGLALLLGGAGLLVVAGRVRAA